MKRVLVTGGAGTIGRIVISYLLAEGKYEITAVDLKTKKSQDRLKRFKRRINIVYGDICDKVLINALVKDHDYIIHLASTKIMFSNINKNLCYSVDYLGTKNIVEAIKNVNPKCHLFFSSTTAFYKKENKASVKDRVDIDENDYYKYYKYECEKIISKLDNYTIYRLPIVLSNPIKEEFVYNVKNSKVDYITNKDAANAFVLGIKKSDLVNKNTYNLASESNIEYKELMNSILKITGINAKLVLSKLFLPKDYTSFVCKDRDVLNNIIDYRIDSLPEYLMRLRRQIKKRRLAKLLVKPFIKK